jgi:hypothetical protein
VVIAGDCQRGDFGIGVAFVGHQCCGQGDVDIVLAGSTRRLIGDLFRLRDLFRYC